MKVEERVRRRAQAESLTHSVRLRSACRKQSLKKKKKVPGQFVVVKYRSETQWWTQKLIREDYRVDKHWVLFIFLGWDLKLAGWDYDF